MLFSPGGLGDMGYNDCILQGIQQFKKSNVNIDVYISSPASLDEAEQIFSDWLKRPQSDIPVLFILATSDYEPIVEKHLAQHKLTDNKRLLLFESLKRYDEEKVSTFQISMFGASYLAGAMADWCNEGKSLVLLANPSDGPISVARDGFIAGNGGRCDVEYLADDWTGFVSANTAYKNMSRWAQDYGFIFPVVGGSNLGIFRYSREYADSPLLAGMDIDQSSLSDKITGSVIKHIDQLIYEYLSEWAQTGELPASQLYGLESGYIDWKLAPEFRAAYQSLVDNIRQLAITEEEAYYENNAD